MAKWYQSHVTVLHVFANWPVVDVIASPQTYEMQPIALKDIDRGALKEQLRHFVEPDLSTGVATDPVLAEARDVYREILAQADVQKADLIVIGSHGRSGFERLLLGSITEKVLRKATCPVMVRRTLQPDCLPH